MAHYAHWLPTPEAHDWRTQALCAEVGYAVFFPEGPPSAVDSANQEAIRICKRCPVAADCLADALANDERFGIWGGKTPLERARMKGRKK